MAETKVCAHPACSCIAAEGEDYCSTTCHDASDLEELACQCQHAGCQGEALKAS